MTPPTQKCSRCWFYGQILRAWLPVFQQPNGALRLGHLTQRHRAESHPSIARVSAEAFEVVEKDTPC